jgi:ABC-type lipoprotein export system ATPase subunit
MLTRLRIKRFKRLLDVDIELGESVVFIGPNNSGKTAALQALALWYTGLQRWLEKRQGKTQPEKRPGVTINRKDLISISVPRANLLWYDLHVRNIIAPTQNTKQQTQNIRIDIIVDGVTEGKPWSCGLEFDYANEESFYCRPLRMTEVEGADRMPIPDGTKNTRVAFLPPMSGLAADEPKLELGRINVLIGEGQTAQVLRNLCYQIYESNSSGWQELVKYLNDYFGVTILPPKYIRERGEITMTYEERGPDFDISSSGRGFQQTLLLLAHLYANPQSVLLLDEPDAHLEILRQRQIYQLITEVAEKQGSQIVAASHSEVILNEAADRDVVIAFVGQPHRIDDRGSQVLKSLKSIGFNDFYLAETTGWVLYLEGSTDLAILKAFAKTLQHPAAEHLERPFVYYVGNVLSKVSEHYWGLQEAKTDLVGIAIFDRLDSAIANNPGPRVEQWRRREIENYLCLKEVLLKYARHDQPNDLFGLAEANRRIDVMEKVIDDLSKALKTLGRPEPWSPDIKVTDDFLDPLFEKYFQELRLPNLMRKSDYHVLANLVPKDKIDIEIKEKLDAIVEIASKAKRRED